MLILIVFILPPVTLDISVTYIVYPVILHNYCIARNLPPCKCSFLYKYMVSALIPEIYETSCWVVLHLTVYQTRKVNYPICSCTNKTRKCFTALVRDIKWQSNMPKYLTITDPSNSLICCKQERTLRRTLYYYSRNEQK